MNSTLFPYRILPLGDRALVIDFGNRIDEALNEYVLQLFYWLRQHPLPGMTEAIPAYSSLAICYDTAGVKKKLPAGLTTFDQMKEQAAELLSRDIPEMPLTPRLHRIPVCYDLPLAPDLPAVAAANQLSVEQVIELHCAGSYRVFMLGFLPGFAYLGEVDERIAMSRKTQPQPIQAGSVGIAGRQTGIYPLSSPGGWQIIGRTPLQLFDRNGLKENPSQLTRLLPGDSVQFYPISQHEFESY